MIYLLPFLNCFLLFICLEEGQIFRRPFAWVQENWFVYLPARLLMMFGGCVLCTSFWMLAVELLIWNLINGSAYGIEKYIVLLCSFPVITNISYKLLKG